MLYSFNYCFLGWLLSQAFGAVSGQALAELCLENGGRWRVRLGSGLKRVRLEESGLCLF
jgi:hypothetical protein